MSWPDRMPRFFGEFKQKQKPRTGSSIILGSLQTKSEPADRKLVA